MTTPTRSNVARKLRMLADGIEQHSPERPFVIASETYTKAELVAAIRAMQAAAQRVLSARGDLADAIVADQQVQADGAQLLRVTCQTFVTMFSDQLNVLADFGLEPVRQRPPPTGEEILIRVTKSRATRKARRTMGKRQREAIKG